MLKLKNRGNRGFTIVELLIVVVVIAILAAVTVVAYTNIQNRAHDSAVQKDLSAAAKKTSLLIAEAGAIPAGNRSMAYDGASGVGAANGAPSPLIDVTASKSSYDNSVTAGSANFVYCTGPSLVSGQQEYTWSGRSRSGRVFSYSSENGLVSLGMTGMSGAAICNGIGYPRTSSYGYFSNSSGWQSWVK